MKPANVFVFTDTSLGVDLRVVFYADRVVRVTRTVSGTESSAREFSVRTEPDASAAPATEDLGASTRLSTGAVAVTVDKTTLAVSFAAPDGPTLLAEKPYGAKLVPVVYPSGATCRVSQEFGTATGASFWGLGQHQDGTLNQRGSRILLSQLNKEIAIPFFVSSDGYGVFWNNPSPTVFEDSRFGTSFASEAGDRVDYFYFAGGSDQEVVRAFQRLTGGVELPPRWSFGYLQSKERYASQYELLEVARRYRKLGVPLDGVIQDWQYWGDSEEWNSMEFLNPAFPDMKGTVKRLHDENVHVLISVWPTFGRRCRAYRELQERGMLLPFRVAEGSDATKTYDAWNPEARAFYWELLRREVLPSGVDGLWMDASEPEQEFPRTQYMFDRPADPFDAPTAAGPFRTVRNTYPLVHVEGVADRMRKDFGGRRPCVLTRCAYAGQQRTGSFCWSGDVLSTWDALRRQLPAGVNFGLSGIPFWNTDIGGFFGDKEFHGGVTEPGFRELYVRWLQFGVFMPMMRSHGTNYPREIWQMGEPGDWAFDAVARGIRLRYRLLPYIYSQAGLTARHGGSMMRPATDGPGTGAVADDEFLFGDALLVAPVTEAQYVRKGTADFSKPGLRDVTLPKGVWFDYYTEKTAGGSFRRETPIDLVPFYVRGGSTLPLGPDVQYASEKAWDPLDLVVYPGADGESRLYEDAFDGMGYTRGECTEIPLRWSEAARTLTLGAREGAFPEMLARRVFRVRLAGTVRTVDVAYDGAETHVALP